MVWSGLIDTLGALLIPALYNSFGIFMMRQFMHGIPNELIDAARIDGASELRIYAQVVLPLTRPALAALGILEFIWSWDAFIWPLLVLNTRSKFTLPIGLANFNQEFGTDFGALMAGSVIAVIPMFVVYVALQRYFVAGIALTGQKG
ncbi:MAG TPA: carbohydrate ABC transporter permease [Thermomicrobiales bacterium]|jgi:multiple sugar transport system permease protein